jgi:hypothetical protein
MAMPWKLGVITKIKENSEQRPGGKARAPVPRD